MAQVTLRMQQGETLYRDIFCGTTPLAFYIQSALGPSSVDTVRIVLHLLFAGCVLLTASIGSSLRIAKPLLVAALAAMIVGCRPMPYSLYSAWALLFLLATVDVGLRIAHRSSLAAVAGALAGLSFASKYNVGILAFACLLAVIALFNGSGWKRHAAMATAAFAIVATAFLLPIVYSGGWEQFVVQCFTGKSVYVKTGFSSIPSRWWWMYLSAAALPMLLVIGWFRDRDRTQLILLLLTVAALASAFPRPDLTHLRIAIPGLVLGAAGCIAQWKRFERLHRALAILGCCLATAYYADAAIAQRRNGPYQNLHLERMNRISMPSHDAQAFLRSVRSLQEHAGTDRSLFILHPNAAVYYLASGLRNPTRYDFPLVTTFGPNGQQQLIERIRSREIASICVMPLPWETLPPEHLIGYIVENLTPGADAGPCRVFTAPR